MKRAYKTTYRTTYKSAHLGAKLNVLDESYIYFDAVEAEDGGFVVSKTATNSAFHYAVDKEVFNDIAIWTNKISFGRNFNYDDDMVLRPSTQFDSYLTAVEAEENGFIEDKTNTNRDLKISVAKNA